MNNPFIKVYLTDETGLIYYVAIQTGSGKYSFDPAGTSIPTPIMILPKGWSDVKLMWDRDPLYLGVFRSQSQTFKFVEDARAVLLNLFYASGGGIQANCTMRIDQFISVNVGYEIAYESQIDFSQANDIKFNQGCDKNIIQKGEFSVSTLDSLLYEYLQSGANTQFNIPIWIIDTNPLSPTYNEYIPNDSVFVLHNGLKLLYQANWTSSARSIQPDGTYDPLHYGLWYTVSPVAPYFPGAYQLNGWNNGAIGDGYHIVPSFTQYNIVQNNGTTTFIGNDILQPFLIQSNQTPGSANFASEDSFAGINHTEPYTRNNYSLKNLLQNTTNGTAKMSATVTFKFNGSLTDPNSFGVITSAGGGTVTGRYFAFCIFEINSNDLPTTYVSGSGTRYITPGNIDPITGLQNGVMLCKIYLPNGGGDMNVTAIPPTPATAYTMATLGAVLTGNQTFTSLPVTFDINFNKVYVFGLICDVEHSGSYGSAIYCSFGFDLLEFSMQSYYDNGSSGIPVPAPSLNSSIFPAMRLGTLLSKIIPNLNTTQTDIYGFPIPVAGTTFVGASTILNNPAQPPIADLAPYNLLVASDYCIHDLQGFAYIPISFSQLFNFCKKVIGCGASISADGTTLSIERLSNYFQDLMILNLDDYQGVANLSIKPHNDGSGSNLKLGYSKADTNSDFGVIPVNTELYYNTPLTKLASVIDWEESDILVEENAIEKKFAQIVSQPIGQGFDPANPSSNNGLNAFYCLPNSYPTTIQAYRPGNVPPPLGTGTETQNVPISVNVYPILQRNGIAPNPPCAQNYDKAAVTQPYINGLYYPDSSYNIECSPCRALQRDGGAWLHSMLDNCDGENLTFRNSGVMQYNNFALGLSGISSNLDIGSGIGGVIDEFADKPISGLPPKLFRPFIFTIDTVAPVNMWSIMNTNPNGYIQFTWKGMIFKGFIWSVSQMLAASGHTSFELLAHPTTTNQQLIDA